MQHALKTWPEHFAAIKRNEKTLEVRKADRDFNVGDVLELREYDPNTQTYSGDRCLRLVTHVLVGGQFGIEDGYVALSMEDPSSAHVTPRRVEAILDKYRCERCGNFHVERPCGGRTEWVWALAEVLDAELRYPEPGLT